jgi:hypothetical protein
VPLGLNDWVGIAVGGAIAVYLLASGVIASSEQTALVAGAGLLVGMAFTRFLGAPDSHAKGVLMLAAFLGPTIAIGNSAYQALGALYLLCCAVGVLLARRLGLIGPGSPYSAHRKRGRSEL